MPPVGAHLRRLRNPRLSSLPCRESTMTFAQGGEGDKPQWALISTAAVIVLHDSLRSTHRSLNRGSARPGPNGRSVRHGNLHAVRLSKNALGLAAAVCHACAACAACTCASTARHCPRGTGRVR